MLERTRYNSDNDVCSVIHSILIILGERGKRVAICIIMQFEDVCAHGISLNYIGVLSVVTFKMN
jgi:hypothetical protein